jgi:uncharacterized protein (DUF736 family)
VSDYDNTDKGALFKNDKTGGNPNWPDYRGSINVGGTEFWLNAWIKKSKKGDTYMSLSVKPKQEGGQRVARDAPASDPTPFSDDIPF